MQGGRNPEQGPYGKGSTDQGQGPLSGGNGAALGAFAGLEGDQKELEHFLPTACLFFLPLASLMCSLLSHHTASCQEELEIYRV